MIQTRTNVLIISVAWSSSALGGVVGSSSCSSSSCSSGSRVQPHLRSASEIASSAVSSSSTRGGDMSVDKWKQLYEKKYQQRYCLPSLLLFNMPVCHSVDMCVYIYVVS
jgi:hypothetical protein